MLFAFYRQAKFAIWRDCPEIGRSLGKVELMPRMVLRKTAIGVHVRSAARAGAQICNQFFQLEPAAFYLDGNKDFSGQRPDHEIETIGRRAMFRAARLEADVTPEPAPFQDQPRCRCELAEIFAEEPRRFVREKPITWPRLRLIGRQQQLARDVALLVYRK